MTPRIFTAEIKDYSGQEVTLKGWVKYLRVQKKFTFIILQDAAGTAQILAPTPLPVSIKRDDAIMVVGTVRPDTRASLGFEIDLNQVSVLAEAAPGLPFTSGDPEFTQDLSTILDYRPLSLRTDRIGTIFKVQAKLLEGFRTALRQRRFTEIVSSKIVSSGTEGGANLFPIKYFDRMAYLAQSPQFYKEHGVAGFERVFETGHVYRAEPSSTSRHLAEYYSLDLEMGFIEGPEDLIKLEKEILSEIFDQLRQATDFSTVGFDVYLPSLLNVPTWSFTECLERLKQAHQRTDLVDDLDAEAERQLCALAEKECGVQAVFVLGFPMSARPFYTKPQEDSRYAAGFDFLFRGLEITTGGQRLHTRGELEASLTSRGVDPSSFESHLRMFDVGMPPHGGLAIGLERLTAQVLGLHNIKECSLYPRDRQRVSP
jgi:nondiscriminating aspartyl-tRNA synthetase